MSKIIRNATVAPAVFIGEKQHDALLEARSEKTLGALFPTVSLVTTLEGTKLIPIGEVAKMQEKYQVDCEKARQEGLQRGHEAGLKEGLAEAAKVLSNLERAIQDAVTQRSQLLEDAKQQILDLVIRISRKVTFNGLELDPEISLSIIEGVINQLVDRSSLRIKVHPDHLPVVEQHMDRFLSASTAIKDLKFEADPRVRIGGCFIETPTGDIDARISSQFEVIEQALRAGAEA